MNSIVQDLRLAGARLRSKPGHFVIVGLILALGIGATTAIFTLVDATRFRPFDLPAGDRLVRPRGSAHVWRRGADPGAGERCGRGHSRVEGEPHRCCGGVAIRVNLRPQARKEREITCLDS